jgi:hypothetical protein
MLIPEVADFREIVMRGFRSWFLPRSLDRSNSGRSGGALFFCGLAAAKV